MCGEQHFLYRIKWLMEGSPPRVRGTDPYLCQNYANTGITPACAGNSDAIGEVKPFEGDHPRVCGEQSYRLRRIWSQEGSPPRVRGTVVFPVLQDRKSRITPACAGNRILLWSSLKP